MEYIHRALPIRGKIHTMDIINVPFSINHRAASYIPIITKGYKRLIIQLTNKSGTTDVKYVALNSANTVDTSLTSIKDNKNIILTSTIDPETKSNIYDVTEHDLIILQIGTGSSSYPAIGGTYSLYTK